MIEAVKLAELLWSPFSNQIKTGDPVFFCFHSEMLAELFTEAGLEFQEPSEIVNSVSNSFLFIDGDEIDIDRKIFIKGQNGLSLVIILICQQILIVEDMVRDPNGFSEHAYFPRLRSKISPELSSKSLNPFSFEDFEEIWRQFSKDIQRIAGGSERTVTFQFGVERGINKARSFPFSQALLSREDLLVLVKRIGLNELRTWSHDQVWNSVRRTRMYLRRRGQRLIALSILKDRIVEQVKSFATNIDQNKLAAAAEVLIEPKDSILGFFKEQIDWQNEEYRVFVSTTDNSERFFDEKSISKIIEESLKKKGFLVLPPNEVGDVWYKRKQHDEVFVGETFLVLGSTSEINRALELLRKLGINTKVICEFSVGGRSQEKVVELLLLEALGSKIVLSDGSLIATKTAALSDQYEWIGGVCVERRTQKYLPQHLPQSVKFGEVEFKLADSIRINDKSIFGDIWLKNPSAYIGNVGVDLYFANGKKARLAIAFTDQSEVDLMGLRVTESGHIAPVLDRVQKEIDAVVGFNSPLADRLPFSAVQVGILLNELMVASGEELSVNTIREIKNRIQSPNIPIEVLEIILNRLDRKPRIPKEILLQLGIFA